MFNPAKLLLDPYARAVSGSVVPDGPIYGYRRRRGGLDGRGAAQRGPRDDVDSAPYVPRSVVVHDDFDWGDDEQVAAAHRWTDTVIYELHVKGFTRCTPTCPRSSAAPTPASPPTPRVRLPQGPRRHHRRAAAGAPERVRAATSARRADELLGLQLDRVLRAAQRLQLDRRPRPAGHASSRRWSRRCTRAGLEVILDVVYNHTAEGSPLGPTL